jgi:hypothetical protein
MPKEHKATKALETIGSVSPLINLLTSDKDGREWLTQAITAEGPPHKQWQHIQVLSRLQKLMALKAKKNGIKFSPAMQNNIVVKTPHHNLELPIGFPTSVQKTEKELSKGPEHEVAYTAILLQAIEWLIAREK